MYNYDTQNYSKSCFNHMTFLGNKFSYTLVHLIKIFKFPSLPSCRRILAHESPYLWLTNAWWLNMEFGTLPGSLRIQYTFMAICQ